MPDSSQVVDDALRIWNAGVEAVKPQSLFQKKVHLDGSWLRVEHVQLDLSAVRRLIIVGAGKASAAMAMAFQQHVLSHLPKHGLQPTVQGWINSPEGTFSSADHARLGNVVLHAARPAGLNEPTDAAVHGTQKILDLVADCNAQDVVICLLSGGGSALLAAPKPGVSLTDKQAVAREISAAGGNIDQLNAVRRALSDVKGGGLARACGSGRLVTLIISDVLGDPLETIASGPTVLESANDPVAALEVLQALGLMQRPALAKVIDCLRKNAANKPQVVAARSQTIIDHVILANNADAVDAAGAQAVALGYSYVMQASRGPEGDVELLASKAADAVEQLSQQSDIDCWISGGEPTVKLPPGGAGKGGRNQQLALAVLQQLCDRGWPQAAAWQRSLAFVSGGTDGEDGPTDAAGAWFDRALYERADAAGLQPQTYLERADAYTFFDQVQGLLRTGATGTNVCDLRVALAAQSDR